MKDIFNGGDGYDGWFWVMDVIFRVQGKKKKFVDGLWKVNVVNLKFWWMKFDNVFLIELIFEFRVWGVCNMGILICGDRRLVQLGGGGFSVVWWKILEYLIGQIFMRIVFEYVFI